MARQFDVCVECRQCVGLCEVFPVAFDQILSTPDREAGECTPAQQDEVVDRCSFCRACTLRCPHADAPASIDIFELMTRMQAMRAREGLIGGSRLISMAVRRAPQTLRARRAERRCLGFAFDGDEPIGCCGAGARFVGDVDGAIAARERLAAAAAGRDLDLGDLRFGDDRCRFESTS